VTECQPDRDKALLDAVVQVALEPAPLLVPSGHDPGARLLDLGQPAADLDAQAGDLDREPGGLDDALEQIGMLAQCTVVNDSRELQLTPSHRRARPVPTGEFAHDVARRIDVDTLARKPEVELDAPIGLPLRRTASTSPTPPEANPAAAQAMPAQASSPWGPASALSSTARAIPATVTPAATHGAIRRSRIRPSSARPDGSASVLSLPPRHVLPLAKAGGRIDAHPPVRT
jgi:hypothetical protein